MGFPFRGDTPFDYSHSEFGVSLCEDHARVNTNLDLVRFPATNRDFVPNSPFTEEQFSGNPIFFQQLCSLL